MASDSMSRTIAWSGGVKARVRSRRRVGLLSGLLLGALAACSADRAPARGQLMLAMQTDMSLPKDVSSIRIQIKRLGESVFDRSYPVGDGAVKLPATLAVVASDDPSDTVEIRVLAFRGDEVRTLNRTVTTVPESRIAMLRVPVQWLCDGFVTATGDGDERSFESSCEADTEGERACVAGSCVGVVVASAELPDFEPEQVFGGADTPSDEGRCFPTETCFDAGFDIVADDGCTVELAASESDEANFALRTGLGADGICSERDCYVPLDGAAGFGFVELEGTASRRRFQLPEGVCRAVDDGRAEGLVASLACRTKTPSTPTCGPWSSVEGDGADSVLDGGTPGAGGAPGGAGQGGTPSGGGESGAATDGGQGGTPAGEGGEGGSDPGGVSGSGGEAGSTGGGGAVPSTTPIALGWGHSCRIVDGSLVCWGDNGDGQIGDGTTVKRSLPVTVPGLTGVVSLALGRAHTCALDSGGSVWCWGNGSFGQIGTSDRLGSVIPVEVYQGAVAIAAGSDHTCAATGAGNVVCWGDNSAGQLGNGDAGPLSGEPVDVEGLTSARTLASFGGRTCAVTDDGGVSCWGHATGELAARVVSLGKVAPATGAMSVEGVSDAVSVAVGEQHVCAASADGSLRCWGDNLYGQLGTGDNEARSTPVRVSAVTGVVQVVAGDVHTCARLEGGTVSCFGGNEFGQLGTPSGPSSSVPASVPGVHGVTALSAGRRHACALIGEDSTLCWGSNDSGQLGIGAVSRGGGETPVTVAIGFDANRGEGRAKLAVGFEHACAIVTAPGTTPWPAAPFTSLGGGNGSSTCAIDDATRAWCWGNGSFGQLGGGNTRSYGIPTLNGLTDVVSIASSYGHACAAFGDGSVACWGENSTGQIGDGTTTGSWFPVLVSGVSNAVEIVVGDYHSCARDTFGAVKCWGAGGQGELGDGNAQSSLVPVTVALSQPASSIGAGIRHTCAVLLDGTVSCWGANDSSQIGDGSFYTAYSPTTALDVSGATRVDGGADHTCALLSSGGIQCWGNNFSGQVGAGVLDTYLNATAVSGIDDAIAIDLGFNYTCAILSGGFPTCWGDNAAGQLGTGNYDSSNVPVAVAGYPEGGVAAILTSGSHTCLLASDGTLACLGGNYNGELGIGNQDPTSVATPVARPSVPAAAGAVACWGDNEVLQGGTALGRDNLVPRVVPSVTAVAVASGAMHTCILEDAGGVKCWGDNLYGQLGDVEAPAGIVPVTVPGITNAHGIVAGSNHTCVLLETGGVLCWGDNTYGQLGYEGALPGPQPVQNLPAGVTAIAAGHGHTCALLAEGTVSCWGDDQFAQLGSGVQRSPRATPGVVPGLSGIRALALGAYHACGVAHDGLVYCWGHNSSLQLGDRTSGGTLSPALVNGIANVVGIGAGETHTCAVTANGTVACWGTGPSGALGSAVTSSATPLELPNLSGVLTVDLSGLFYTGGESQGAASCAFGFDGAVNCWGIGSSGLLGDGSVESISVEPVRALLP
jgi:alpha-tubulin suppressor-like RCC1 family protein